MCMREIAPVVCPICSCSCKLQPIKTFRFLSRPNYLWRHISNNVRFTSCVCCCFSIQWRFFVYGFFVVARMFDSNDIGKNASINVLTNIQVNSDPSKVYVTKSQCIHNRFFFFTFGLRKIFSSQANLVVAYIRYSMSGIVTLFQLTFYESISFVWQGRKPFDSSKIDFYHSMVSWPFCV